MQTCEGWGGLRWNVCVWYLTWAAAYHVGGLQKSVFETVLCLQISADLISFVATEIGRRLGWRRKDSQKRLITFGMHSEGTGTCDLTALQRKYFRGPNAFRGQKGSYHLTVLYPQGKLLHQWFFPPIFCGCYFSEEWLWASKAMLWLCLRSF